jgi:hypothetical protein
LVLLPIIIVSQNVIPTSQDARAEADHETLTALHTINVRQLRPAPISIVVVPRWESVCESGEIESTL